MKRRLKNEILTHQLVIVRIFPTIDKVASTKVLHCNAPVGVYIATKVGFTYFLLRIFTLTAEHPCSDEVLDRLSTCEDRFSINLEISL